MAWDGSAAAYGELVAANLPRDWLDPENNPVDAAVIAAMAANPSAVFALLKGVSQQSRISTATGSFLDLAAQDFFGPGQFPRRAGEADESYRERIKAEILRPRVTREALSSALSALTGLAPTIVEPNRPANTLGWGRMAFGAAGCWSTRTQPFQIFVTVYNPPVFSGPGYPGWGQGAFGVSMASSAAPVPTVSDEEIYRTITRTLPAGVTAWTAIVYGNPLNEQPASLASGEYDFTSSNTTLLFPSIL